MFATNQNPSSNQHIDNKRNPAAAGFLALLIAKHALD
jgi:hypothetical protein